MIKEGDYVYVHTLYKDDITEEVSIGVYKVRTGGLTYVYVHGIDIVFFDDQYIKVIPNKINKLLYKDLP